jgi:hypothetical protein
LLEWRPARQKRHGRRGEGLTTATNHSVNARGNDFRSGILLRNFRRLDPATVSEIYRAQIAHITLPPGNPPKAMARTARHLAGRAAQGSVALAHIDSKTAGPFTPIRPERRRTTRIQTPIPLFVYGHLRDSDPFYEDTSTLSFNAHGGCIPLHTAVQLGQRLLVINQRNEHEQRCIVVFVGAHSACGVDVAFSFTAAMPYFWGDWDNAKSRERAGNCEPPATWDESNAFPALTR